MKYGTSQKRQWPTIYLLVRSPINLLWVKCSTVGISCRNIWEKKTESNNTKNTKIININFTRWKANPPVRVGVAVSASGTCLRACLHSAHPRDATKDRATRGCPIPMRPLIAVNQCVVVLLCCCVVVLKAGNKMKEPVINLHTQYFPLKWILVFPKRPQNGNFNAIVRWVLQNNRGKYNEKFQ